MTTKDILIHAAGNLVKNIILSSDDVWWPSDSNRMHSILSHYRGPKLDFTHWWASEREFGFEKSYGISLDNKNNFTEFVTHKVEGLKPAVFMSHSFISESSNTIKLFMDHVNMIYIRPETDLGISWQIRAAHCKIRPGINLVESLKSVNYTFSGGDLSGQIEKHIAIHGIDETFRENKRNMHEIVHRQIAMFSDIAKEYEIPVIALEDFILADPSYIATKLEDILNIKFNVDFVSEILTLWRGKHWDFTDTLNWDVTNFTKNHE